MTTSTETAFDLEQAARAFFAAELVDVIFLSGVFVDRTDAAIAVRHGIGAIDPACLLGQAIELWYSLNQPYMERAGVAVDLAIIEALFTAAHLCAPEGSE